MSRDEIVTQPLTALARLAAALSAGTDADSDSDAHADKLLAEARVAGATRHEIAAALAAAREFGSDARLIDELCDALAADTAPWTEKRTVTLGGYPTVVARRSGRSGPAMVLCHSIALDHAMWEPMVAALPPDIDVLAYDLRAHGHHADPGVPFSLEACADDLRDLADSLALGPIYPVGISMGGAVVQQFAAQYPDMLAGLAIIASAGRGGPAAADRAADGERDGLAAQVGTTLSRWFSARSLAENGPWVRYARHRIVSWNTAAWGQAWRSLANRDMFPRLRAVTAPALCIAGDADSSAPPTAVQAVADALPRGSLTVLAGPHLINLESPGDVAATLAAHHRGL
jgi:3-oxoadipate enol-lactonase / 4-carboxymuconolactone decarboxylase